MKQLRKIISSAALCVTAFTSTAQDFVVRDNLEYIGMPVGGIATGQLYLGGDGQLWNWDIFNVARLNPGGGGDRFYLNPMTQEQWFANGFSIRVVDGKKVYKRRINTTGFSDIEFDGQYPVAYVSYRDKQLPVEVKLSAFSPFIPTDAEGSGLPITVLEYEVHNNGTTKLEIELDGWLQNMAGFQSKKINAATHNNKTETGANFSRVVLSSSESLKEIAPDWGSMSLTLLGDGYASAQMQTTNGSPMFYSAVNKTESATSPQGTPLIGGVGSKFTLGKGESRTLTFLVSWYFPNVHLWNGSHHWKGRENMRYYYSTNFDCAADVSNHLINNWHLVDNTKLWNSNWYDTTLPRNFMDRTFANVSTLATTATQRFDDLTDDPHNEGRYYNFEGVYLGEGTCTHVSHYEQILGRIFPSLARSHRQKIDLGLSLSPEGIIGYRGEFSRFGQHDGRGYAVDGQAGTILRIYREHLMSPDDTFLKQNWSKIKSAMQYMINHDKGDSKKADGILEGIQYNTLDRMWYGKISWTSGLYAAALRASEMMAEDAGDRKFAKECHRIADLAYENIPAELFNGEYFIQKLDPKHPEAPNTNNGCHIDQLLGQYWAWQLGLGDIVPREMSEKAFSAILKHNHVENYNKFLQRTEIPISRWYADGDESGLIMCAFPNGGADKAPGVVANDWERLVVGYFSEIWTGQEHAVAAALINASMVDEGMKVIDDINDRYDASKRNPYNEIEYGNHYTRAMSGYAPFISATGFFCNSPKGIIEFAPKMSNENFKAPFIASEGWGSYEQKQTNDSEEYSLNLLYGKMRLTQINLPSKIEKGTVTLTLEDKTYSVKTSTHSSMKHIELPESLSLSAGDIIHVSIERR